MTKAALVDPDLRPYSTLERAVDDRLSLAVGVESTEEALIDALRGRDVLFTTSNLPVTGSVLERTDLDVVAKLGTGIDNVDLEAARESGVPVTYTPGVNAHAVAEHTVALALAVGRNVVSSDEALCGGTWRDELPLGRTLVGRTVGIVGFGDVGRRVAGLLSGFDVDVIAHDPYVRPEDTEVTGASLVPFGELLDRSDVVAVNAELTPETRGLVGSAELERMRSSAILVNTARGPIVSESALVEALRDGEIAGAGLDVFETEPLPTTSPLHEFDDVVLTPHVAAMTEDARTRSIETLADNVLAMLSGAPVPERYLAVAPG